MKGTLTIDPVTHLSLSQSRFWTATLH